MKPKKQLQILLPVLLLIIATPSTRLPGATASAMPQIIQIGFSANPEKGNSISPFQPLLSDPTSVFSFGFLRVGSDQLDLVIIHLPSSQPVWRAIPARPANWAGSTSLSFNGSLLLSDTETGVLWSTGTGIGDQLVLLNSSNLQIQKLGEPISVIWQSFDFPSDTLVQGQNFTSATTIFSVNEQFSMRLGDSYLALYMEFGGGTAAMYWKQTALEAKAQIVTEGGPIYARVNPIGFLGMYQNERAPVDVLAFDTFNRGLPGFRRMTLESDGNLRAYYWNGSIWAKDFTAITEQCELPTACGAYGLCSVMESRCGCLDNSTSGCPPPASGDLCGVGRDGYWVLRRKGVDLANKELMGFEKMGSLEECEGSCERNCSCWGAVYSNSSGYCYRINFPIQTVEAVGDERKLGYFKVRTGDGGGRRGSTNKTPALALMVVGAGVFAVGAGYGAYRIWERRRRRSGVEASMVEGLATMPSYKDLASSSFRSIELSNSFRKK